MSGQIINLNDTTPAPATGYRNVKWQKGASTGTDPIYGLPIFPVSAEVPDMVGTIGLVIDGGGSTPATGAKGVIQVPYAGTITGWTMLADVSGSAQITISKGSYAAFPTVSSIVASAPPNLSSAQKATSTTLTGWTTAISAGDILSFNLDSISTITRLILELQVTRS